MAAPSRRRRFVIRERNQGGFYYFLLNLKSVVRLFLTPENLDFADDLYEVNFRLFDAVRTLSLLLDDLARGGPNPTGLPSDVAAVQ